MTPSSATESPLHPPAFLAHVEAAARNRGFRLDRYGMLEDKWGNRISMASHMEDVSPEEIEARMAKMGG